MSPRNFGAPEKRLIFKICPELVGRGAKVFMFIIIISLVRETTRALILIRETTRAINRKLSASL